MRACYPRARDVRRIPTITLLLLAALLGSLVAGASWASLVALFGLLASLVFALRRLDLALGLTLAIAFFFAPIKDFLPSSLSYFVVDLMLLVCVVSWVATKVLHREAILEASPLRVPILALVLYAAALVFHPGRPVLAGVAGWRAWSLFLILYFVGFDLARERGFVPRALGVLYGLGLAVAGRIDPIDQAGNVVQRVAAARPQEGLTHRLTGGPAVQQSLEQLQKHIGLARDRDVRVDLPALSLSKIVPRLVDGLGTAAENQRPF